MPTLDEALARAHAGIAILPVWYLSPDEVCACPTFCGRNACKHPIADHGVHSATTDAATIRRWWTQHPHANLGEACGKASHDLLCGDIDARAVADALIAIADPLIAEGYRVETSPHGCHLYFRGTFAGVLHFYTPAGERVAELRGTNAYVVAAPSVNAFRQPYRYLGGPLDPRALLHAPDPIATLQQLLARVGIEARVTKQAEIGPATVPTIAAQDVPFKLATAYARAIESGAYINRDGKLDRSGMLWGYAQHLIDAAQKRFLLLPDEQIAGILKRIDSAYPRYRKYADRADADKQYFAIPWKIRAGLAPPAAEGGAGEGGSGDGSGDGNGAGAAPTGGVGTDYAWAQAEGRMRLVHVQRRSDLRVASFLPQIVSENTVVLSDGRQESEYVVRCTLASGESTDVVLRAEDLASARVLRAAWRKQLDSRYIVEPDMWERLWNAAQELSPTDKVKTVVYARTGWHETDEGWAFVFPNGTALTAAGVSTAIRGRPFEGTKFKTYVRYGVGVRPAQTTAEWETVHDALTALLTMGAPRVVIPMLLLMFGAPLRSLGVAPEPPLVHLHGESNEHKTSLALTALSLYGDFPSGPYASGARTILESWSATVNAIEDALHLLRDLVVLVDDYKPDTVRAAEVKRLVQNYGDHASRSRMDRTGNRQQAHDPQAFWLTTGQDQWDKEMSDATRTLPVLVRRGDIPGPDLDRAQRQVPTGAVALVGGSYLRWVAEQHDAIAARLAPYRDAERRQIDFVAPDRVLSVATTLRVMHRLVHDWLEAELPTLVPLYDRIFAEGWRAFRMALAQHGHDASELRPIQQLLGAIAEHLATGQAFFVSRDRNVASAVERIKAGAFGTAVGLQDARYIYLLQSVTFDRWYAPLLQRAGTAPAFSWKALKRSARETLHAEDCQLRELGSVQSIRIARDRAGLEEIVEVLTETTGSGGDAAGNAGDVV